MAGILLVFGLIPSGVVIHQICLLQHRRLCPRVSYDRSPGLLHRGKRPLLWNAEFLQRYLNGLWRNHQNPTPAFDPFVDWETIWQSTPGMRRCLYCNLQLAVLYFDHVYRTNGFGEGVYLTGGTSDHPLPCTEWSH